MTDVPAPQPDAELDPTEWRAPVTDRVQAPVEPDPDLLPFPDRSWPDFERITLVIAEQVDGVRGGRLYGTPGQAQLGIDLYGSNGDGRNVAYQSKRYQSFTPEDLAAAVDKFDGDDRAVGATKLVIVVACATDRTEMSDKLEELRSAHPDIEIDLYDQRSLSESLRTRPDLVSRLFGEAWANAFCRGVPWPVPVASDADVLGDALVRGPIEGLGLDGTLDEARGLADSDPIAAAALLHRVVEDLANGGFRAFTGDLDVDPIHVRQNGLLEDWGCDPPSPQGAL